MEQGFKISTGILAGGKSSRMGTNKALLQYNNRRFIDRIINELGGFSETLISVAKKGEYEELGLPVCCDEHCDIGPIEGIYQILKHASEEYVFICAVDMPFINGNLVRYMAEFISSDYDCYVIMDDDRVHPLCAIYSKKILPVVEEQIAKGQYRLVNILSRVRTKYIELKYTCFDKKVVRNINTKEEYKSLSLPAVFCVSGIKDSGKTGLIIKLINEFIAQNYKVGVIKHDGHDYIMDHEGTDTRRFTEAGAEISAIFSDTQYSINARKCVDAEQMVRKLDGMDIIILEGFKYSSYPKVEVVRSAVSCASVCSPDTLICIATDIVSPKDVKCPVYDIDDTKGIFLCLKKYFELE
jgi:molybdopterin-guanine dinucleotide biosynthesis protein